MGRERRDDSGVIRKIRVPFNRQRRLLAAGAARLRQKQANATPQKAKKLTHDKLALMLDPGYDPDRNFAALHRLIWLYAV